MRLKKKQKEAVLRWIAEGLQSDEINQRAAEFIPPFQVFRQQVDYYRRTRRADIAALVKVGEQDALTEGLATKGERVKKLKVGTLRRSLNMRSSTRAKWTHIGECWTTSPKRWGIGHSAWSTPARGAGRSSW
jgi:hypothetical protein